MKDLCEYIIESLKIKKSARYYNYYPENGDELENLIDKLLKERGYSADLNDIDVSNVTDMNGMFAFSKFNGDISDWDVSKVENMRSMFRSSKFNGDISKWDVSSVKSMNRMFEHCPLENNPPAWYR